jgi:hypothetical protein
MIDRNWGRCVSEICPRTEAITISALLHTKFIFDYDGLKLWRITDNEQLIFEKNNTPLILITIYEN